MSLGANSSTAIKACFLCCYILRILNSTLDSKHILRSVWDLCMVLYERSWLVDEIKLGIKVELLKISSALKIQINLFSCTRIEQMMHNKTTTE